MTDQSQSADTILLSRNVIPMGGGVEKIDGVAFSGKNIAAVGSRSQLEGLRGSGTKALDFGDRPVLPGFLDIHAHLELTSMALFSTVDVHTPPRQSIDEMLQALRDNIHLSELRSGWLIGQGSLYQDQRL